MKKTLYSKFLFIYLLFALMMLILISTLSSKLINNSQIQNKAEDLYREANLIASSYTDYYYDSNVNYQSLKTNLDVLATYQNADIMIITAEGRILLTTLDDGTLYPGYHITDFNPINSNESYYDVGNFYGIFDTDVLSVCSPIINDYQTSGYVIIHTPIQQVLLIANRMLNNSYIVGFVILLFSLLILLTFTLLVFRPLSKIRYGAEQFAAGNLDYEIPVKSQDEIGYLAASLNYMSDELSETEEYQRRLIANISHDFRSPLTSIRGYIEAMLDGTIPVEMQERYLRIVLSETDRLTKLTSSLLALNQYDTKKIMLDITDFDINNVIKNTIRTFEGICTSKKIFIELVLESESLFVTADMGKIQQVLYNLIDNAIKFSPNDSSIRIETTTVHEKIMISVKDSGIGIPKDSLKKIWERFYKTDISRGKDKKGIGLGLSIVKEIIQAHDENINVISTQDVGTEFIFTLTKAKNQGLSR